MEHTMPDMPPTHVNLDELDLAPLLNAAASLLDEAAQFAHDATANKYQLSEVSILHWMGATIRALDAERELTRLELEPDMPPFLRADKGPRIVSGARERHDAYLRFRDWLLAARGGTADGWGQSAGPSWTLPVGTTVLPDVTPEVNRLREIVDMLRRALGNETGQAPATNTIVSLGNRCYRIANHRPVVIGTDEDYILQAFLKCPAMDEQQLREKSGLPDAVKVLKGLASWLDGIFAPAINFPGGKNRGGYHVRIRSE
jgi:hypothetical protein